MFLLLFEITGSSSFCCRLQRVSSKVSMERNTVNQMWNTECSERSECDGSRNISIQDNEFCLFITWCFSTFLCLCLTICYRTIDYRISGTNGWTQVSLGQQRCVRAGVCAFLCVCKKARERGECVSERVCVCSLVEAMEKEGER